MYVRWQLYEAPSKYLWLRSETCRYVQFIYTYTYIYNYSILYIIAFTADLCNVLYY